jgi:hypothetical protein
MLKILARNLSNKEKAARQPVDWFYNHCQTNYVIQINKNLPGKFIGG